jgi:hypothetical protein
VSCDASWAVAAATRSRSEIARSWCCPASAAAASSRDLGRRAVLEAPRTLRRRRSTRAGERARTCARASSDRGAPIPAWRTSSRAACLRIEHACDRTLDGVSAQAADQSVHGVFRWVRRGAASRASRVAAV